MARVLVLVSCLWLGGCNQLFGIEQLKPAAAGRAGAPAAESGGAGAASQEPEEDAGI